MSNAEKNSPSQKKQMIVMVAALALCAVLVTWTVLLLKDRWDQNQTNEQTSQYDIAEVSSESEDETEVTTTGTGIGMWEEVLAGVTTTEKTRATTVTSETSATAPVTKKLVTQAAIFVKVTTAKPVTTKHPTAGTTTRHIAAGTTTGRSSGTLPHKTTVTTAKQTTTHSTVQTASATKPQTTTAVPQTTPPPATAAPSAGQVVYNQLLAVYLGAGAQNGNAYYFEPANGSQPTVVMGNANGYHAVCKGDDSLKSLALGGTGDSSDNPWQTGAGFTFRKSSGNNYAFYESAGSNNKVLGAFNPDTGDNVWMRVHYTEENGAVKAEYHIYKRSASGVQNELSSGTSDAGSIYAIPADLASIAAAAGFPAGDLSQLPEVTANAQGDLAALRNHAGTYNDGFALQPGSLYGVIATNSTNVYLRAGMSLASNVIGSLPAGTFVCVDSGYDPENPGMWCPVTVNLNGTWQSGYVSAVYVLTWKAE